MPIKLGVQPCIEDCFNLHRCMRERNRQIIDQLEALKNLMSKRWIEQINALLTLTREQDRAFGHEESNIHLIYLYYKRCRQKNHMSIRDAQQYLLSISSIRPSKTHYIFLSKCLEIFEAMYQQEETSGERV